MDTIYTVKKGDSLKEIALKFHTTPTIISKDNNLTISPYPGMRLIIREAGILHYVKPFEKLSSIAKKYDVSVENIISKNNLLTPELFVGQILSIPKENL